MSMSRELKALQQFQQGSPTFGTRRGTALPSDRTALNLTTIDESSETTTSGESSTTAIDESTLFMEELRIEVQQLRRELVEAQAAIEEAQNAIEAKDRELARVSAECERVSGEARGVLTMVSTMRDAMGTGPTSLQAFFESFLESQSKLLAAQSNALAVQNAPPLTCFTGDNIEVEENSFSAWIELFEERATLLTWSDQQKLYQLKSHLSKTALQVYKLLTPEQKASYDQVVAALKERFKPVDIEELRGLEFHQLIQSGESVEQLGLRLMVLAKKAFPSLAAEERDRLLKGRFFQALLPKWQRKLGAPKIAESFNELYERARVCERHDQQYRANSRSKDNTGTADAKPPGDSYISGSDTVGDKDSGRTTSQRFKRHTSTIKCFLCGEMGHFRRSCPKQQSDRSEALGRSPGTTGASTAVVGAGRETQLVTAQQQDLLQSLSDEQLEGVLAARQCAQEQIFLESDHGNVSVVSGSGYVPAIGNTPELDITIEGVDFTAMVDSGSQATIISRAALHEIGRHLRSRGKPMPTLQPPSVKLYGKDSKHKLHITAQVTVTVAADGVSAPVILFVQPNSKQSCLLGMNAATALKLSFLNANGQPLRTSGMHREGYGQVNLIQTKAIPARAQSFVEAEVESKALRGTSVYFECDKSIESHGLAAPDSLLRVSEKGQVLIPVVNFQQQVVHLEGSTLLGCVEAVNEDGGFDNELVVEGQDCGDVSLSDAVQDKGVCVAEVSASGSEGMELAPMEEASRKARLLAAIEWPENLQQSQLEKLQELVCEFADVFALSDEELGCTGVVKHNIDTGDCQPVRQHPRRTPFSQRRKIASLIADMESKGVVKPSTSAWASPVVLVPKKDGSTRFCVDYRCLNAITKKDVYPLPRIEDILDTVGRCQYFTTLDLSSGYWQIQLNPDTSDKTAFTTHCGLFEFTRMPFGLCNAPATFQRLMETVLAGLVWKSCFVYIDDMLVSSKTFEEHLAHLRKVLQRLRDANLKLKVVKCCFLRPSVKYLGHVISKDGIAPDPTKTDKVRNYPVPTDVTKLRQFLGLASYYRRFICNFAKVALPLQTLTKKGVPFEWTIACQQSFDQLKDLLCSAPVLIYPKFGPGHQFLLETDASLEGLGAVLSQNDEKGYPHPVAYASRTLHKHEKNYPITELETLGLVWAVKYFRAYLLGHHCVVLTDHSACTSLLKATHPSAKLARWAMTIQEMDLDIQHRSGKSNLSADALSRNPVVEVSEGMVATVRVDASVFVDDQYNDADFRPMMDYLKSGTLPVDDKDARKIILQSKYFDLIDETLHHENPLFPGKWCLAVPKCRRQQLIHEAHDGRFSGHFAEKRIYELLRRRYWWPGMRAEVRTYCRSCLVCASRRGAGHSIKPALQPIPVGGPFHRVGVDVLQLPLTLNGNQYAVVFIDYLTKWVEVFAVANQTAQTIAKLLVEGVICRHGAPAELLSDRGTNFMSELVAEVCALFNVKKVNTSGYHPQTNGLCERFNSTLIQMLAKTGERFGQDWDKHLPYVLFAYRSTVQESTKESPFFLLYGRDPALPTLEALSRERSPYIIDLDDYKTDLTTGLTAAWKLAQENIRLAQQRQKTAYDKAATETSLKVGQRVMVHMPSEVKGDTWKFARPYHGPFRIKSLTPTNAEVQLIDEPSSAPLFVSLTRVRPCYSELPDVAWKGISPGKYAPRTPPPSTPAPSRSTEARYTGPVTRSRAAKQTAS